MRKGNSMDSINTMFKGALGGPLSKDANFARELKEVQMYYEFYDAFDATNRNEDYGQTWKTPSGMDYEPTKEVRNYTKKLIDKQARFMTGTPPEVVVRAVGRGQEEQAENKRLLLDEILQRAGFWNKMSKALLDATVGKRVLMMVIANEGKPINVRFYPMPQFTYTMDPTNSNELLSVDVVYQDERTLGKEGSQQLWHHYRYEMKSSSESSALGTATIEGRPEETCWLTYSLTDGDDRQMYQASKNDSEQVLTTSINEAETITITDSDGSEVEVPIIIRESTSTGFSRIPAYVIKNESLTGDIYGSSDLKDLMPIADNYNRTISDLRDALKFKMFEQPVIIDGDSKSIAALKIAPNALIDLKTDKSASLNKGMAQAKVTTLASTFQFMQSTQYYLDEAKRAMYEIMDQPLPEKIQEAPSGKAMKFLFYDLMSRCDRKWIEWDDAIIWLFELIKESLETVPNLYPDLGESLLSSINVETTETLRHIYPLPEDENEKRQTSINEVTARVKSISSHIKEFSNTENEQSEFELIVEELRILNEVENGFNNLVNNTANQNVGSEGAIDEKDKSTEKPINEEEKNAGTEGIKPQ